MSFGSRSLHAPLKLPDHVVTVVCSNQRFSCCISILIGFSRTYGCQQLATIHQPTVEEKLRERLKFFANVQLHLEHEVFFYCLSTPCICHAAVILQNAVSVLWKKKNQLLSTCVSLAVSTPCIGCQRKHACIRPLPPPPPSSSLFTYACGLETQLYI